MKIDYELIDNMVTWDEITADIYQTETGLCFPNIDENARDLFPAWLVNFLGTYDRLTGYLYKYGFRW